MSLQVEHFPNLEDLLANDPSIPPPAGLYRRIAAFLVDLLLLATIGLLFGCTMPAISYNLGYIGRLLGLVVFLAYFGTFNSRLANGQTPGKRLFKIAVRNSSCQPVEIGRSILRSGILAAPFFLFGWELPVFPHHPLVSVQRFVVVGLGCAIIFTLLFNRRPRQGLHDLLCGTYVLHLKGSPLRELPRSTKTGMFIAIAWMLMLVFILTIAGLLRPQVVITPFMADTTATRNTLESDPRFFRVSLEDRERYSYRSEGVHTFFVEVWIKGLPDEAQQDAILDSLAETVLDSARNIDRSDLLEIRVISQFDLGFARYSQSFSRSAPPGEWRLNTQSDPN